MICQVGGWSKQARERMKAGYHRQGLATLCNNLSPGTECLSGPPCRIWGAKLTFCSLVDHPLGGAEHQGAITAARQALAYLHV